MTSHLLPYYFFFCDKQHNIVSLQHIIDLLGEVFYIFFRFRNVLKHVMCQINYNDLPIIRKEYQLTPINVYSLPVNVKLQLHDAIYRLRFYSNSLIHILSLSNWHNNVASIQKNRGD